MSLGELYLEVFLTMIDTMLPAPAAYASVAAAPAIQEITWNVPNVAGGAAEANILAKGAACEFRFTSAQQLNRYTKAVPQRAESGDVAAGRSQMWR